MWCALTVLAKIALYIILPRTKLVDSVYLYMDESGTKQPDHIPPQLPAHGYDWFSQGGILVNDNDINSAKIILTDFLAKWTQIRAPLHSYEIRGAHKNFAWLKKLSSKDRNSFLTDLGKTMLALPVIGIACVIDRPGYNHRYGSKYGDERWSLCKTAFAITVERAAKHAMSQDRKLRVYVERSSKKEEEILLGYYKQLKETGSWFDSTSSALYMPVQSDQYKNTLYEFKVKTKQSLLMQVADMYLWPMSIGGYDQANRSYNELIAAGKLINCHVSNPDVLGIKYSCFDH